MQDNGLSAAAEDMTKAWEFYRKYATREPKDDAFYDDMVNEADKVGITTTLGHKVMVAVIDTISTEDWKEKTKTW